jgi:hypothetical protein
LFQWWKNGVRRRWQCAINPAVKEEGSVWELVGLTNEMVEWIIINVNGESSGNISDSDLVFEGIHPLSESDCILNTTSKKC